MKSFSPHGALRNFFQKNKPENPSPFTQSRIQSRVLSHFLYHYSTSRSSFSWSIFKKSVTLGSFAVMASLIAMLLPKNYGVAGEIRPLAGEIQIERNGTKMFVTEVSEIHVGDRIFIPSESRAHVTFPYKFISAIEGDTHIRVVDNESLFVESGELRSTALDRSEFATRQGLIVSDPGSTFRVSVSSSGSTQIFPEINKLHVFDLLEGSLTLEAGEVLDLYSDTHLSNIQTLPDNLNLSEKQLTAIRLKLAISRSKLATGLKLLQQNNIREADKVFASAQESFLSVMQVFQTSRELEIIRRLNVSHFTIANVVDRANKKIDHQPTIDNIKGMAALLEIINEYEKELSGQSGILSTGIRSFDRYQLLYILSQKGNENQQRAAKVIINQYPDIFLSLINRASNTLDQLTIINNAISQIPDNEISQEFFRQVTKQLPQNLSNIVNEKIQSR